MNSSLGSLSEAPPCLPCGSTCPPLHAHRHQAHPHLTQQPLAPPERGKKHRAAVRVCLPLIRRYSGYSTRLGTRQSAEPGGAGGGGRAPRAPRSTWWEGEAATAQPYSPQIPVVVVPRTSPLLFQQAQAPRRASPMPPHHHQHHQQQGKARLRQTRAGFLLPGDKQETTQLNK